MRNPIVKAFTIIRFLNRLGMRVDPTYIGLVDNGTRIWDSKDKTYVKQLALTTYKNNLWSREWPS